MKERDYIEGLTENGKVTTVNDPDAIRWSLVRRITAKIWVFTNSKNQNL